VCRFGADLMRFWAIFAPRVLQISVGNDRKKSKSTGCCDRKFVFFIDYALLEKNYLQWFLVFSGEIF
jgi:hypothetical protein